MAAAVAAVSSPSLVTPVPPVPFNVPGGDAARFEEATHDAPPLGQEAACDETALARLMLAPRSEESSKELLGMLVAAARQRLPVAVAALRMRASLQLLATYNRPLHWWNVAELLQLDLLDIVQNLLWSHDLAVQTDEVSQLLSELSALSQLPKKSKLSKEGLATQVRALWLKWADERGLSSPHLCTQLPVLPTQASIVACFDHAAQHAEGVYPYAFSSLLRACVQQWDQRIPFDVPLVCSPHVSLDVVAEKWQDWLPKEFVEQSEDFFGPGNESQKDGCPLCIDQQQGRNFQQQRLVQQQRRLRLLKQVRRPIGWGDGRVVGTVGKCILLDPLGKICYNGKTFWRVSSAEGPANSLTHDDYLVGVTWGERETRSLSKDKPDYVCDALDEAPLPDLKDYSVWVHPGVPSGCCPRHQNAFRLLRLAFPAVPSMALTWFLVFCADAANTNSYECMLAARRWFQVFN